MAHNDPAAAVEGFGFRATVFGGRHPITEHWHDAFARAGAGRFRRGADGNRAFEGFHVRDMEAIRDEYGQSDVVIYLTADPGFAEADLDKICAPLAAQLGVAVVSQGERSGKWFTLIATNRPPAAYPGLRISRSQPALDVVELKFNDGSGRVENLAYGQEFKS